MAFATGILMFDADLLLMVFPTRAFSINFKYFFMPILAYLAFHHWQAAHRYSKLLAQPQLYHFTGAMVPSLFLWAAAVCGWVLSVSHAALIVFFSTLFGAY